MHHPVLATFVHEHLFLPVNNTYKYNNKLNTLPDELAKMYSIHSKFQLQECLKMHPDKNCNFSNITEYFTANQPLLFASFVCSNLTNCCKIMLIYVKK